MPDARRPFVVGTAVLVLTAGLAVAATAAWALRPVAAATPPPARHTVATAGGEEDGQTPLDLAAWKLDLWRPFEDAAPPPPPAPPAPPPFKLFSISSERGVRQAALDLGETGLVFLGEGQKRGKVTVTKIEGAAVVLDYEGRSLRLELDR